MLCLLIKTGVAQISNLLTNSTFFTSVNPDPPSPPNPPIRIPPKSCTPWPRASRAFHQADPDTVLLVNRLRPILESYGSQMGRHQL